MLMLHIFSCGSYPPPPVTQHACVVPHGTPVVFLSVRGMAALSVHLYI